MMRCIKIENPKVRFRDGEITLDPNDRLYFQKRAYKDDSGMEVTEYILGWDKKPYYIPKERIHVGVFTDSKVKEETIKRFLQRIINGWPVHDKKQQKQQLWYFPGIKKMFSINVEITEPRPLSNIEQRHLDTEYDVVLVALRQMDERKYDIRLELFSKAIPNKFIITTRPLHMPQYIYSVGRGLVARAGNFVPYILSDEIVNLITGYMGKDVQFIFLDSTRIGFIKGSLQLATAAIIGNVNGTVSSVRIVPHASERDKITAVLDELKHNGDLDRNTILCANGPISDKDIKTYEQMVQSTGILSVLLEVSRSTLDPLLTHMDCNTPWGYGVEIANGERYIVNLTWAPDYPGITRPIVFCFRNDPIKDIHFRRSLIKYLAWSSALSPEAPVRPPSFPFYLHEADLLCKLIHKLYVHLRKQGKDAIKALNEVRSSLERLANEKGGLPLLIHGER